MITSVEIENFRCFKQLRIERLARVNLVVGANNSGKTALLEAIEAIVSRENPFLLYRASLERGEVRRRREAAETVVDIDLRHWFHGHRLGPGVGFSLHATGERELSVSRTVEMVPPSTPGSPFHLRTVGLRSRPPVGFVTTDRIQPEELALLWANVVLTPGEACTVEALRLVEPAIERIAISESDGMIAKVWLRGAKDPVPLGTLGEGVSRILTLAIHLVRTQGGFLLIEEIEDGLHWSVMPKVWRFLIETAIARNVQVFATTHSKDWLEGLADPHRANPELAAEVSVHRLEAGRETSVRFDASRIAECIELELEAR